jgi:hypothetical protein
MMCLQTRLSQRVLALGALGALAAVAAGCSEAQAGTGPNNVGVSQQPQLLDDLAKTCGLACPGSEDDKGLEIKGIVEGNAAISGVASVDAFFSSVINFQGAAKGVAGGIKGQLDAIRGDFGIAASADLATELKAKFDANLDGSVEFKAEPPRCEADVQATLQAQARCDAEFSPGKAMVECKGSCEVEASATAMCSAQAELECTFVPPDLKCMGECKGSCTVEATAAASCSGTCRGSCSGNCSAYVKNASGSAECAGECDGMCTGSCEAELAVAASCMGTCKGECTVTKPSGGCEGGIRAECKAMANASVMCDGKCVGEFEPPMAKAECKASAKADAKINIQCTPPRMSLSYKLKVAAGAEIQARAKFEAALKTLVNTRLPALRAEIARGNSVSSAGADLVTAAGAAVSGSIETTIKGDASFRAKFGLACAVKELPKVKTVIDKSTNELKAQLDAAGKITGMLKV